MKRKGSSSLRSAAEAMSFAIACQQVIALRLFRMALGGAAAKREARRMVSEKAAAAVRAQFAAAQALPGGGLSGAAAAAKAVYRKAVRANGRRLRRR
jgi:hypothetical protein